MPYIFYATIAAICFAGSILTGKILAKNSTSNPKSIFVLFLWLNLIPATLIYLIYRPIWSSSALLPLFVYSLTFTVGGYLFSYALYKVDASIIGPLFQVQSGFIVILAAVFLQEKFSNLNYFLMTIMIIGAMLVSLNEHMSIAGFMRPGIVLIVGMQFLHAISNIFVKVTLQYVDFYAVIFYGSLINALLATLLYLHSKPKVIFPAPAFGLFLARSTLQVVGATALFKAFTQNVSIASVIGLMSAPIVFVVSVLCSRWIPQLLEHHTAKVYAIRGVGLVIILFAAVTLSLSK